MANRDRPMGFIPVRMLDGSKIPTMRWKINSATSNIFVGDAVSKDSGGGIERTVASDGILIVGVVEQLQDSNGIAIGSHGSLISTKYLASGNSGYAVVVLALPGAIFRIQSDGATAEADIWNCAPILATAGDTTTGRSKMELDYSNQSSSATEELLIVGKVDEPGNDWDLTDVDLLVIFNENAWIGNGSVIGV